MSGLYIYIPITEPSGVYIWFIHLHADYYPLVCISGLYSHIPITKPPLVILLNYWTVMSLDVYNRSCRMCGMTSSSSVHPHTLY